MRLRDPRGIEFAVDFEYVNAFGAHVNVGFFRGAEIADPAGLLAGTGRFLEGTGWTRSYSVVTIHAP